MQSRKLIRSILSKLDRCPYVLGITIDLSKEQVRGYCRIRNMMCERVMAYELCRDYKSEKRKDE